MKGLTTQTYVGLSVVLVILVSLAYAANWTYQNRPTASTTPDLSNPNVFIDQLNASIGRIIPSIPQELASELKNSSMYFMLANKGSSYTRPYVFTKNAFSSISADIAQPEYLSFSHNNNKLAFFAVAPERANMAAGWHVRAQAYVYDSADLNNEAFPAMNLDNTHVASSNGISLKRFLSVSNTGSILFTGWNGETLPGLQPASNWSIYHSDGNTTRIITSGYMAKWLNDLEFIYLKNDGVYLKNIDTGDDSQLIASEDTVYTNNNIDISDDGKTLVWMRPEKNKIAVYDIAFNSSATERGVIVARSFRSLISPSGKFLAAATIRMDASGDEGVAMEPKIEFFDLTTLQKVPGLTIPFDTFEPLYIFMTDWVTNHSQN